jgi:hypothetical protein
MIIYNRAKPHFNPLPKIYFQLELDEAKKFRRPAEPAFAVHLTEGDFCLSMTMDTDPDFTWYEGDKIRFMLRKRGKPLTSPLLNHNKLSLID